MTGLLIFMLLVMLFNTWATVTYARRAEAAAREASHTSDMIMQGLLTEADQEPLSRRRHL
jgi:hypothetical protein